MSGIQLVAYSDYLCPWCFNASVRLERLSAEDPAVTVSWRSYLLRPAPRERDLEKFRRYTRSWERPAAEEDAGSFQTWQGEAGPPSWSMPPHLVAKAAARLGPNAFTRIHRRLLSAYFAESQDITHDDTLRALWSEQGLPPQAFEERDDPELRRQILAEHQEAVSMGATGVPSVRLADADVVLTGALPLPMYRRWVDRTRARTRSERGSGL